jgi:hypothetical protein
MGEGTTNNTDDTNKNVFLSCFAAFVFCDFEFLDLFRISILGFRISDFSTFPIRRGHRKLFPRSVIILTFGYLSMAWRVFPERYLAVLPFAVGRVDATEKQGDLPHDVLDRFDYVANGDSLALCDRKMPVSTRADRKIGGIDRKIMPLINS